MDINDINKYCKRIRSKTYWELSISNEIKELIYQNVITVTENTIFYFSLWFDGSPLNTNGNQIYSGVSSGIVCCDNCCSNWYKFCGYRHQFNAAERSVETTAKRVISNETKKKKLKYGDFRIPIFFNETTDDLIVIFGTQANGILYIVENVPISSLIGTNWYLFWMW